MNPSNDATPTTYNASRTTVATTLPAPLFDQSFFNRIGSVPTLPSLSFSTDVLTLKELQNLTPQQLIARHVARSARDAFAMWSYRIHFRGIISRDAASSARVNYRSIHDGYEVVSTNDTNVRPIDSLPQRTSRLPPFPEHGTSDDLCTFVSTHVWNVPELRENQMSAIRKLLFNSECDKRMLDPREIWPASTKECRQHSWPAQQNI